MADIVSEAYRINLHIFRNCIILTRDSVTITTTLNRATSILYAHLNSNTLQCYLKEKLFTAYLSVG